MEKLLVFLTRAAKVSNGFGHLIAECLTTVRASNSAGMPAGCDGHTLLDEWIRVDGYLWGRQLEKKVHAFYFQLMQRQAFRRKFALALVRHYGSLTLDFIDRGRAFDGSIFDMTVQLLTEPTRTPKLVTEHGALEELLTTLRQLLRRASVDEVVDCEHRIAVKSSYHRCVQDLEYLLSHEGVAKHMLVDQPQLFSMWLDVVALTHGMVTEVRQLGDHVEFEPFAWLYALNIALTLQSPFMLVLKGFQSSLCQTTTYEDVRTELRSVVSSTIVRCIRKLPAHAWRLGSVSFEGLTTMTDLLLVDWSVGQGSDDGASFHISLHRFLGGILLKLTEAGFAPAHVILHELRELARGELAPLIGQLGVFRTVHRVAGVGVVETRANGPAPISKQLGGSEDADVTALALLLFEPTVRIVTCCAQISAGMWRRNGYAMVSQLHNYADYRLREHLQDVDMLLLQLSLTVLGPAHFSIMLLDKFALTHWFERGICEAHSTEHALALAEAFVRLLIVVSTDRSALHIDATVVLLRSELIHRLLLGGATHSELLKGVGVSLGNHADFDAILHEVAVRKMATRDLNAQATYHLKKELFAEYNPYFLHLSIEEHEKAAEIVNANLEPGRTIVVPLPPPAPAGFASLAELLVCEPVLRIVDSIIAAYTDGLAEPAAASSSTADGRASEHSTAQQSPLGASALIGSSSAPAHSKAESTHPVPSRHWVSDRLLIHALSLLQTALDSARSEPQRLQPLLEYVLSDSVPLLRNLQRLVLKKGSGQSGRSDSVGAPLAKHIADGLRAADARVVPKMGMGNDADSDAKEEEDEDAERARRKERALAARQRAMESMKAMQRSFSETGAGGGAAPMDMDEEELEEEEDAEEHCIVCMQVLRPTLAPAGFALQLFNRMQGGPSMGMVAMCLPSRELQPCCTNFESSATPNLAELPKLASLLATIGIHNGKIDKVSSMPQFVRVLSQCASEEQTSLLAVLLSTRRVDCLQVFLSQGGLAHLLEWLLQDAGSGSGAAEEVRLCALRACFGPGPPSQAETCAAMR